MSNLRLPLLILAVGLAGLAGAQNVTVQYLQGALATDLSADGSVIVGNRQGNYETFRWTQETGVVYLGRSSIDALGSGAGGPKVSADGTRVSATIASEDGTYGTQGRWTLGLGWEETMPPPPADGELQGDFWGSAWGLSGDGETLVGLYWRDNFLDGGAHASAWTSATGVVDLGSGGGNSRANAASYDGSVIVGWDENPDFGTWWPTVWRDGVRTVLTETDWFCLANCVTDDGTVIGGVSVDPATTSRTGALWIWNGTSYDEQIIGVLDGTFPGGNGQAIVNGITPDGEMCVGYNQFDFNPGFASGFIWTLEGGMIDVVDFLDDNSVALPSGFTLQTLTGVSDDGSVMVGIGQHSTPPFNSETVIIRVDSVSDAPDAAALAGGMELGANYPNPFNPSTHVPVTLARDGFVKLEVFNAAGHRVRTLHQGQLTAGRHEFRWDGRNAQGMSVPSGVYLARVRDNAGHAVSRRLTLMK